MIKQCLYSNQKSAGSSLTTLTLLSSSSPVPPKTKSKAARSSNTVARRNKELQVAIVSIDISWGTVCRLGSGVIDGTLGGVLGGLRGSF